MRKLLRFLVAGALVGSGPALAQSTPEDAAQALVAAGAAPAATAGRVTAEELDFAVAGLRVVDGDMAALPDDAWHMGSITKSMTAVLAARLVEGGLIEWDSTVGDVLGPTFPEIHPDWQDTTLAALLTHRSGMGANLSRASTRDLGQGPRADYVEEMLFDPPEGEPGEFLYSNAGYVVAGAMLEVAGRAPWEVLIAREVFDPLGLEGAGFGPPQEGIEGHERRFFGDLRAVGTGPGADNIAAMGPAGRVHMPTRDVLVYLRAHLIRDEAVLSAASWEVLHTPVGEEAYAMGWGVGEDGSMVHSGSNTLWYAVAYLDAAAGEAAFVAVNSGNLEVVAEAVDQAVRSLLHGR